MVGIEADSLAWNLMKREKKFDVDFTMSPEANKIVNQRVRSFFMNPEKGMGPKRAAAIVIERKKPAEDSKHSEVEDKVSKKLKGK